MGSNRSRRRLARTTKVESLEVRQLFSAEPIGGLLGSLEQHTFVESPVEQHASTTADFWYDADLDRDLDALLGDIEQSLASAHQLTGVAQARTDYGFYGNGQTVVVIDSGIAWDHASLGGGFGSDYRVVGGWDFTEEDDANPYDDGPAGAHGTHVAGIVGATANGAGDAGVAPGVDLVGLRVFNDQGAGYFSWVENALRWVHDNRSSFANPITAVNLSLGTAWNAATVPNWAMLEDEFAQLEADGIFIAVSAGNSFSTYNATGLSYPAVSSHVVPVMSVDDAGSLSYFSQRHSRAIAAPGRSIRSTVPDYVGNQNRVTDDWANFSGTSMASPYVAGASVLIREAMQFVGYTDISQDTIYDHMMATADRFFDSATNQFYKRLNVAAALDALVPDDEFGSTAGTAHDLGAIGSTGLEVSGLIGKRDDIDYFQFTAAASGTVTFAASTTQGLEALWSGDGVVGSDGLTFTINVVAGETYQVGLASSGGIGYFDLTIAAKNERVVVDWGTIQNEFKNDLVVDGEAWFRVSASQTGYLTAKSLSSTSGKDIQLSWYDANMQPVVSSLNATSQSRADFWAEAGDVMYLRVAGNCADADIQVVNQVAIGDSVVSVTGTAAADRFTFVANATRLCVSVNGIDYDFSRIVASKIEINGDAGLDTITMTGTSGNETAVMRPHDVSFTGSGFSVLARSIENVTLNGQTGHDTVTLYDSAGNDTFTAYPDRVGIQGQGFWNVAFGFEFVYANAIAGGNDRAVFYDSAGNDTFTAFPDRVAMQGATFWNVAAGFDITTAYAIAGGNDRAIFYDSAGKDSFTAYPDRAGMQGTDYWNIATGFECVLAYAIAGGNDRAVFYDSAGNDTFTAFPARAGMQGSGYWNVAAGFECAVAYAVAGGTDYAVFYDSTGNDIYSARPDRAVLQGGNFLNVAAGFEQSIAYSIAGGDDRAEFYDSVGDDLFTARANRVSMRGTGYLNIASGFRRADAFAIFGGVDRAEFVDTPQDESILAAVWGVRMTGDKFNNEIHGFDEVLARRFDESVRVEVDSTDFVFSLVGQDP